MLPGNGRTLFFHAVVHHAQTEARITDKKKLNLVYLHLVQIAVIFVFAQMPCPPEWGDATGRSIVFLVQQ